MAPENGKLEIRKAGERGHASHGWLNTYHTFSFADYYDRAHMGFRSLRVINDDTVNGGAGFPAHGHRDMEILTYVLEGALEHRDSMGNGSVIRPGNVQRMSAGTGVTHSEFNHSRTEPVHLLQIWIIPERRGLTPGYEEAEFPEAERRGVLRRVAARDGEGGAVTVHQDVAVYATLLGEGERVAHNLAAERGAWIHVARGRARVNGAALEAGDGASLAGPAELTLEGAGGDELAELLVFDLA
jgi:redox-sensitive bicupin YhaK (pirin superfamily)